MSMPDEQEDHWKAYYEKLGRREPRLLFNKLMEIIEADGGFSTPGVAIDLGSGDGTESLALLSAGWRVLAIDQSPNAIERVTAGAQLIDATRLQTQQAYFTQANLPAADVIYAGLSLPFCAPEDFPAVWRKIRRAVNPGGYFGGHLFGERDNWASQPDLAGQPEMTFVTPEQVQAMSAGWQVKLLEEVEEDRPSAFQEMWHYHYFNLILRREADQG